MIKILQRYYFKRRIHAYLDSDLSIRHTIKMGRIFSGKYGDLFSENEIDHYASNVIHRRNEILINAMLRTGMGTVFSTKTLNMIEYFCQHSLTSSLDTLLEIKPDCISDILLASYKVKNFGLVYHFSQRAEISDHSQLMKIVRKNSKCVFYQQLVDILKRCNDNAKYKQILAL